MLASTHCSATDAASALHVCLTCGCWLMFVVAVSMWVSEARSVILHHTSHECPQSRKESSFTASKNRAYVKMWDGKITGKLIIDDGLRRKTQELVRKKAKERTQQRDNSSLSVKHFVGRVYGKRSEHHWDCIMKWAKMILPALMGMWRKM